MHRISLRSQKVISFPRVRVLAKRRKTDQQRRPLDQIGSGNGRYGVVRRAHEGQYLVDPLQGPVETDLYPTGGVRHIPPLVLATPTLEEADVYGAQFGQFEHGLVTPESSLVEQLGEELLVEDQVGHLLGDLVDGLGVKVVHAVVQTTLDEDAVLREAVDIDGSSLVPQHQACVG